MNFKLDEDQKQLQDAVRRIVVSERAHQRLRAVIDGKTGWDADLWSDLASFGALGLVVPEEFDGAGLTMVELALVAELLGYAGAATPFLGHVLATIAIVYGGDDDQKARWLPDLASGAKIATVALSDGNDTWEPADWTLAPKDGRISGRKINVPSGTQADLLVVGLDGGRLGVVETARGGVSAQAMDVLDLTRPLAAVTFDGAPVEVLADSAKGAERMTDASRVLLAADAFGGSWRILEMTRDYTQVREAFGARLAQFQGIKHQEANMVLEIEPTRGLYWFAAYAYDHDVPRSSHAACLAKAHAAETFLQSARMGTELHGGIGFTWAYDSHIWLKRSMFDYAWGGRPERLFERAADIEGW
jgi:alkylation response protein AidB-like acyl-CoA dehydrogenase